MAKGQVKTLYISESISPDIIKNVNTLAEREKLDDEQTPNPHRIARKLLREASNAWLNHPELYNQLMTTIAQIEDKVKEKIA
jgi:hypothetical protein